MNGQTDWDEYVDRIDELIAAGEYVSRADAGMEVRRRFPHLANVKFTGTGVGNGQLRSGAVAGSGSAEAQLTAIAKQIAAERRISFVQAYVQALNSNAELYVRYLKEQEAAISRSRHG